MTSAREITADEVRALLCYCICTGRFTWLIKQTRVPKGALAGSANGGGYIAIQIRGKKYKASRLAWLWVHGQWPQGVIDHIDGNVGNDRFLNLRDVSRQVNQQNQRNGQGASGLLGVCLSHGKFEARIRINGKQVRLGLFNTKEQAHAAYLEAKRRHHEGCAL